MEMKFPVPLEQQVPQTIEWNFEEFLTAADDIASKYVGAIYDEKHIADAKADRAELSSYINDLETARKTIKNLFNETITRFEGQIKQVEHKFITVRTQIDGQIKAFDEKRKAEKREMIAAIFLEVFDEYLSVITLEKIWDDKWLNKTYYIDKIEDEMISLNKKIKGEITAIHALKSEDEAQLLAVYFDRLSLSEAMLENDRLKKAKERAKAFTKPIKANVTITQTVITEENIVTYKLELKGTMEQMKSLRRFLDENNIQYKKIGGEQ